MVTYREFLSIGLEKCGSDKETFSALTDKWNEKKDRIRDMDSETVAELLECPR